MGRFLDMMAKERRKQDAKVRRWLAAKLTHAEIADRLGVTRQRAQQIISRLNGHGKK